MSKFSRSDRGYVLINALLIVAALSALAVQSLKDSNMRQAEVADAQTGAGIALIADAGVAFAADLIRADFAGAPYDHEGENWALQNRRIEVGRGVVEVSVVDVQARLNLNHMNGIGDDETPEMLVQLSRWLALEPAVAEAIAAHYRMTTSLNENEEDGQVVIAPLEEEDIPDWYVAGDLAHLLDVLMLPGITPDTLSRLSLHVSTLPQNSRLNVNTADRAALAAATGLSQEATDEILALRTRTPFEELTDFENAVDSLTSDTSDVSVSDGVLGVSSSWFDVRTVTQLNGISVTQMTRLYRDPDSGEVSRHYQQRIQP